MKHLRMRSLLPALAFALVFVGCSRGDTQSTPTPRASPSASATATPSGTTVPSMRAVNFEDPAVAGDLIRRAGGGEVHQDRVLYADLIGKDGVEEAVVIVDSGGTAGEIGAAVYQLRAARPVLVQFLRYNGRVEVRGDLLVTLEGASQPGDAQCCPSKLRETTYHWDGASLAVLTQQEIVNPSR